MTQARAKESPPLPKPSALVQPNDSPPVGCSRVPINYRWEPLSPKLAVEMWPLIQEKSKEAFAGHDARPPDPDWEQYTRDQIAGRLHIITARCNGDLAGYIVWMIHRNIHRKKEIIARTDTYYISPKYRKGYAAGRDMYTLSETRLRELGAKAIITHGNEIFAHKRGTPDSVDRFFKGIGFKPLQMFYEKEI